MVEGKEEEELKREGYVGGEGGKERRISRKEIEKEMLTLGSSDNARELRQVVDNGKTLSLGEAARAWAEDVVQFGLFLALGVVEVNVVEGGREQEEVLVKRGRGREGGGMVRADEGSLWQGWLWRGSRLRRV